MILDDRLEKILKEVWSLGQNTNHYPLSNDLIAIENAKAKINQAFVDEGYATMKELAELIIKEPVMTGQEWYERFVGELKDDGAIAVYWYFEDILTAAKKAAGL